MELSDDTEQKKASDPKIGKPNAATATATTPQQNPQQQQQQHCAETKLADNAPALQPKNKLVFATMDSFQQPQQQQHPQLQHQLTTMPALDVATTLQQPQLLPPRRRSITLRLLEEVMLPMAISPLSPPPRPPPPSLSTPFRARFRSLSGSGRLFNAMTTKAAAAAVVAMDELNSGNAGSVAAAAAAAEKYSSMSDSEMRGKSNDDDNSLHPLDARRNNIGNGGGERGGGLGETQRVVDHGIITISWYDGTKTSEMQDHVHNCVLRKLHDEGKDRGGNMKLVNVRLLDEIVTPNSHGEVVLCPFLPDGSAFVLKFKIFIDRPPASLVSTPAVTTGQDPALYLLPRAPDSPGCERPHRRFADHTLPDGTIVPAPYGNDNIVQHTFPSPQEQQHFEMQRMLSAVAALLLQHQQQQLSAGRGSNASLSEMLAQLHPLPDADNDEKKEDDVGETSTISLMPTNNSGTLPVTTTDRMIEEQLRQLNELFLQRNNSFGPSNVVGAGVSKIGGVTTNQNSDRDEAKLVNAYRRAEKKQVIFVISNYLVLFISLIALSAEIQSRLPQWMAWVQENYDSVQNCATDQAALIECLSNGDFSGLVASFLLWATQSASAKRIFLFGFKTPKKLWTVVYEALVSAVCWGTSYLFIRRGLNPNTRQNFIQLYWKDAAYGSLAGFNAAFMKAILKNLVPEEVALEALEGRQLRIIDWFHSLMANE